MNILYIDHYAGSDRYGMEFRPFYMGREWTKMGHDVTVLAADFTHLRKLNPTVEKDFEEEYDSGVRFVFVKCGRYVGNRLKRGKNMLTFIRKLKKNAQFLAEKYKPDVVLNSSTYPYDVYPAEKIARLAGAKLFYEIHDLWPMSLMAVSTLTEKNIAIRNVQKAEDYCYAHCDGVVSILPNADKHIKERGFNNVRFSYVPNGVVLHDGKPESEPLNPGHKSALEALKNSGKFIVLYAGGHALSNALDWYVLSGKKLPDDVAVVLVGKGNEKEKLISIKEENDINNVYFLDPVPKKQIPSLLEEADCLYIGAKKSPLYKYGVGMNKMFDYMLAAKPIINGVESPDSPIELSGCGVDIPAEDAGAVAQAVERIRAMSDEERAEMGEKGRRYVIENHQYETLAAKFIEAIK